MNDFIGKYDSQKDFTSLDAWKKARLVKLFFYSEVVPLLPVEEKFNLNSAKITLNGYIKYVKAQIGTEIKKTEAKKG